MKFSNHTEAAVASISSSVAFLAAAVSPIAAQALGDWTRVTMTEHAMGAAGGLVGALAYAYARRMTQPLSVIASATLALVWCAIFAPIATHLVAVFYPSLNSIMIDPIVTAAAGCMMGACGMVLYEALLRVFDALAKALPDRVDDVLDWLISKLTGAPRKDK